MKASLEGLLRSAIAREESARNLHPGAGIAVSVVRDGEVILESCHGLRDREARLPVTPATVFEICSLTKAFTATACALAEESGALDLDRAINASEPCLSFKDPAVSKAVSVTDLLSHRSGLLANDLLWYYGALRREGVCHAIGKLDLLPDAFRTSFHYNNLAYAAAAHLLEKSVGESWESFVGRRVLQPLGMSKTTFTTPTSGEVAQPYIDGNRVRSAESAAVVAAGGMRSSLGDMTRWLSCLLSDGRAADGTVVVSEKALARTFDRYVAIGDTHQIIFQGLQWLTHEAGYGLGWCLGTLDGQRAFYHPGFLDGFSTVIVVIPEKRLGFVALANVNLTPIPGILIRELYEAISEKPEPRIDPRISGHYENPLYGRLSVEVTNSQATIHYRDQSWPIRASSVDSGDFSVKAFGIDLPMSVRLDANAEGVYRLSIPFSLDPRIPPFVFERSRS